MADKKKVKGRQIAMDSNDVASSFVDGEEEIQVMDEQISSGPLVLNKGAITRTQERRDDVERPEAKKAKLDAEGDRAQLVAVSKEGEENAKAISKENKDLEEKMTKKLDQGFAKVFAMGEISQKSMKAIKKRITELEQEVKEARELGASKEITANGQLRKVVEGIEYCSKALHEIRELTAAKSRKQGGESKLESKQQRTANSRTKPKKVCACCCKEGHFADRCPTYRTWKARKEVMVENGNCTTCGYSKCPSLKPGGAKCKHEDRECYFCEPDDPDRFHMQCLCKTRFPEKEKKTEDTEPNVEEAHRVHPPNGPTISRENSPEPAPTPATIFKGQQTESTPKSYATAAAPTTTSKGQRQDTSDSEEDPLPVYEQG